MHDRFFLNLNLSTVCFLPIFSVFMSSLSLLPSNNDEDEDGRDFRFRPLIFDFLEFLVGDPSILNDSGGSDLALSSSMDF